MVSLSTPQSRPNRTGRSGRPQTNDHRMEPIKVAFIVFICAGRAQAAPSVSTHTRTRTRTHTRTHTHFH